MGKITKYLNELIVGNVFDTPEILEAYATDNSILKVKPKFVAFPESTDDIRKLMRFFNQIASKDIPVSVTPRGSGLDEGGADLSSGLIISTEKMNKLLEIDPRERLVRVQAGITLKELNTALSVSGLTIPVGGHDDETIGGLIANAPIDKYAGKYGGIYNYVDRIEVVLSNGECLQTSRLKKYAVAKKAAEKSLEGDIYRKMSKLLKENEEQLRKMEGEKKGLAGYPNVTKLGHRETMDLKPLLFGSQGTLGIISEVILKATLIKRKPFRFVVTFREFEQALEFAKVVEEMRPREINIFDLKILNMAKETGKNLDGVIKKLEEGYTVFVSLDERMINSGKKIESLKTVAPRTAKFIFETPETRRTINEFENSLTSYLRATKNGERLPILTNFYLPAHTLKNFMDDIKILSQKLELELELYGSYMTSIYNLRPKFNLEEEGINRKIATFLKAGAYIIKRRDGLLTGGTPEGRLKAVVTNEELPPTEKEIYEKIKKIFDQNNILNPDVKLGASSKFTLTHFRDTSLPRIMI